MGKAIVDFLASLIGHVKAGMSCVLLGSLFIVSGISGSKVSDMATVAPALFPEMKRRGNKKPEMVALLATGAAMADTVPPSIVLIVLGSVAGVSIAGLFESGFFVAMVLLTALLLLARWKVGHESVGAKRPPRAVVGRTLLLAAPALVLPFLVIVCAMNIGLMMPPIGVGFYVACRIGDARPDDVMGAIWPYLAALLAGVLVIAMVPAISTFML